MERDRRAERRAQGARDRAFHLENHINNQKILTGRRGRLFFINGIAREPARGTIFKYGQKNHLTKPK